MLGNNGIFGGVVIVMGLACWFLFNAYTGAIERGVQSEVAAKIAKVELEHQHEISRLNAEYLNKLSEKENEITTLKNSSQSEINALRFKVESLTMSAPGQFGDDISVHIKRLWCVFQAGTDTSAINACRNSPVEAFEAGPKLTVTVTPELAEEWAGICEDARDGRIGRKYLDFCHWSLTGFTPQGILSLLSDLEAIINDDKLNEARADAMEEMLKMLGPKDSKEGK